MNIIKRMFTSDDWKLVFAWVCVYGYAYNVMAWSFTFWLTSLATTFTGVQWPAPPLVPWEQLTAMSATLIGIGTVQLFKSKKKDEDKLGSSE